MALWHDLMTLLKVCFQVSPSFLALTYFQLGFTTKEETYITETTA